ncbi:histidine kinase [Solirubrobacter pauli]|uniref:histidine kinase n=1 Tax=Solirubrobacter pauli TaxID=166793 RepID=A0A660LCF4_9ACTN|nr:histidine kinase [Solirubrobacter pauli]RKQ92737.1 histidine kinase [Solirubrobacter pauli]
MPRRADILWAVLAVAGSLVVLLGGDDGGAAGVLLAVAACAPIAARRTHPLPAAVTALALAALGMALGYTAVVPVLAGLVLCSQAAIHSASRVTLPLTAYAGAVMAAAVAIAGTDPVTPLIMRVVLGFAIGATPVLIGGSIRRERERTREAQEFARRIAELRDRDVERAVAEERLRIARDVHDITGHHLSAISLQAAGASGARGALSDPEVRDALGRIHRLTSEALGQTRRALGVLRASGPATLAPTPRLEQLDQLLEPARAAGLAVDLQLDGSARPLSDEIEVCAYRVLQESLTNVVRHSHATSVRVRVAYGDRELTVEVVDDGVGRPAAPGGGIGGMRERVAIVGGDFSAGPSGRGWTVRASLPLSAQPSGERPRALGATP